MKSMTSYYLSRAILALLFAILFITAGAPWWAGVLIGAGIMAFYIWAPKSGLYTVQSEAGVAPLRRD